MSWTNFCRRATSNIPFSFMNIGSFMRTGEMSAPSLVISTISVSPTLMPAFSQAGMSIWSAMKLCHVALLTISAPSSLFTFAFVRPRILLYMSFLLLNSCWVMLLPPILPTSYLEENMDITLWRSSGLTMNASKAIAITMEMKIPILLRIFSRTAI